MKNLLNKITLASLTIILFCFTSCKKDEEQQGVIIDEIFSHQVVNYDNEYDEIGGLHNEVLTFIYDQKINQYNSQELGETELVQIIMKYQEGKPEALEEDVIVRMAKQLFEIGNSGSPINTSTIDICKIIPSLCNPGPPPFNPYPDVPTFDFLITTDDFDLNYSNALDQINAIKEYEATIINDSSLDENTKKFQLSYASTYRNSTQFWYNKINTGELPIDKMEAINRPCLACGVIYADAAGAAVGDLISPFGGGIHGAMASLVYAQIIFGF